MSVGTVGEWKDVMVAHSEPAYSTIVIRGLKEENARLRGLLEECKPMLKGYAAMHVDKLNLLPWTVFDKDGNAANDLLERIG